MEGSLRYRIALTVATVVLVGFCAWTATLLVAIGDERAALRQRVRVLDAVGLLQVEMVRDEDLGEGTTEAWTGAAETLERRAGRLVSAGCGPGVTRGIQGALVAMNPKEPPQSAGDRARLGNALHTLTMALRAEGAATSEALESRVGSLFVVAISAIGLAVTTLVAAWWVVRSKDRMRRMGERLARQARVDYLTGVWNRRMVIGLLERELARSSRLGLSVSVVMYDLDHFKRINDTLGHASGDLALVEVSAAVSGQLRGYDLLGRLGQEGDTGVSSIERTEELVGRYGGEEFLVVLPGHDIDAGRLVAERLRQAIEDLDTLADQGARITASFGVAASMAGAQVEANGLIQAADAALYKAKEQGRNRVVVHPDPLTGPIWS